MADLDSLGQGGTGLGAAIVRQLQKARTDQEGFRQALGAAIPKMTFALVPAFALLLRVAYRRQRRNFPQHFYVAIHLHAFFFVLLLIGALLEPLAGDLDDLLVLGWGAAYAVAALRRVYGGTIGRTIAKLAAVGVAYSAISLVALIGTFAVTLALL